MSDRDRESEEAWPPAPQQSAAPPKPARRARRYDVVACALSVGGALLYLGINFVKAGFLVELAGAGVAALVGLFGFALGLTQLRSWYGRIAMAVPILCLIWTTISVATLMRGLGSV